MEKGASRFVAGTIVGSPPNLLVPASACHNHRV